VVECEVGSKVVSGERLGGVGCGIEVSNISVRNKLEYVRFASSATAKLAFHLIIYRIFVLF
jgi:hypothetical protein